MSKILIMGGTQFVGKAVAKYLIQKHQSIDIFTRGNIAVDYDGVNRHIKGDRKNKNFVKKALSNKKYDFVIDISAYTSKDAAILIPNLNKSCLKKYIFLSSGAVYNKPESSRSELFKENSPTKLISHPTWGAYGLEKKKAENYIRAQSKKGAINFIIIRPPYIYGKGNNLLREQFYFSRIESGQIILIPANTKTRIQFINTDDLCIFIEQCLINSKAKNEVYNIAYPEIITWRTLVDSVMKACGKKTKIYEISNKTESNARLYSPFRDEDMALDTSKSIRHGFSSPGIDLESGLKTTYTLFLNEVKNKGFVAFKDPKMTRLDEISDLISKQNEF